MNGPKAPRLKSLDLKKIGPKPGESGDHFHPDIDVRKQYLVQIGKDFFAGRFSEQWYGHNFDDWGTSGIQLDKPGTNRSRWKGIWEIVP